MVARDREFKFRSLHSVGKERYVEKVAVYCTV